MNQKLSNTSANTEQNKLNSTQKKNWAKPELLLFSAESTEGKNGGNEGTPVASNGPS